METTGRPAETIALTEAYAKAQGLFRTDADPDPEFDETLELDLAVGRARASPARAGRRTGWTLGSVADEFREQLHRRPGGQRRRPALHAGGRERGGRDLPAPDRLGRDRRHHQLHQHLEPVGDGGRRACWPRRPSRSGLTTPPWVKTSLAPGSRAVTGYLDRAGLTPFLDELRFDLVGYGCTTCIGNSGPLAEPIDAGHRAERPRGRRGALGQPQLRGPHPPAHPRELPRLAAAGRGLRAGRPGRHRPHHRAARRGLRRRAGLPGRHLADLRGDRRRRSATSVDRGALRRELRDACSRATSAGAPCRCPTGETYAWDPDSTYVQLPPFFAAITPEPAAGHRHRRRPRPRGARATRSRPTTSRRPAASRPARPPGATWSSTAWSRATSTASGRGAATTR